MVCGERVSRALLPNSQGHLSLHMCNCFSGGEINRAALHTSTSLQLSQAQEALDVYIPFGFQLPSNQSMQVNCGAVHSVPAARRAAHPLIIATSQ